MHRLILSFLVVTMLSSYAVARTWTRKNGKTVEGEYVKAMAGVLIIKKEDGKQVRIPVRQLTKEDQDAVTELKGGKPKRGSSSRKSSSKNVGQDYKPPKQDDWQKWEPGKVYDRVTTNKAAAGYHMYFPTSYNASNPPPVIFLFHAGGSGRGMMNAFKAPAEKVGWLVVGCDKVRNKMSFADGQAIILEIMNAVIDTVPHNYKRMYVGGFSGGGMRAYYSTASIDAPFAGIVSCGGWIGGKDLQKNKFRKYMAVAIVNGKSDGGAGGWAKSDARVMEDRKCKVKMFDFKGGHTMPPKETLTEVLTWMESDWNTRGNKYAP